MRQQVALQTGRCGGEAASEGATGENSTRLLTRFPADIAVFTGSAAPPLTLGQEAVGCFNDASTWPPLGLTGAAGLRSHRKW